MSDNSDRVDELAAEDSDLANLLSPEQRTVHATASKFLREWAQITGKAFEQEDINGAYAIQMLVDLAAYFSVYNHLPRENFMKMCGTMIDIHRERQKGTEW